MPRWLGRLHATCPHPPLAGRSLGRSAVSALGALGAETRVPSTLIALSVPQEGAEHRRALLSITGASNAQLLADVAFCTAAAKVRTLDRN